MNGEAGVGIVSICIFHKGGEESEEGFGRALGNKVATGTGGIGPAVALSLPSGERTIRT